MTIPRTSTVFRAITVFCAVVLAGAGYAAFAFFHNNIAVDEAAGKAEAGLFGEAYMAFRKRLPWPGSDAIDEALPRLLSRERAESFMQYLSQEKALLERGFVLLRKERFSSCGTANSTKIYKHDKTGLEFVLVPGGSFSMGSPAGEAGRFDDEGPVHEVTVGDFLLCRTECTQEAWDKIGGNDDRFRRGPRLPIERMTWIECTDWCRRAGLRLPTEAEWEYACRAGTKSRFSFSDLDSDLAKHAWYVANSGDKTHPVARKIPNSLGLFDMHGNVWEWCLDAWHGSYEGAPEKGLARIAADSAERICRGGCWLNSARNCRCALRNKAAVDGRGYGIGFRPAADPTR